MNTKTVINPQFINLEKFLQRLPLDFLEQGETIFGGRNTIKVFAEQGVHLNVKSFKTPNLLNQFVYGNFRLSKARRSYEYATSLLGKSINTPSPIGYVELRKGILFQQSFYISVQEDFDGLMREFNSGKLDGREHLLSQFAHFTADMHQKEVLHLDYSPGNILYKKFGTDYSFYLVDLNRMYFGKVSMKEGCRNFRRLWGNDEMIRYIAVEYAKAMNFDIEKCIDLVLLYHKQFWKEFTKRHKDKKPYITE